MFTLGIAIGIFIGFITTGWLFNSLFIEPYYFTHKSFIADKSNKIMTMADGSIWIRTKN